MRSYVVTEPIFSNETDPDLQNSKPSAEWLLTSMTTFNFTARVSCNTRFRVFKVDKLYTYSILFQATKLFFYKFGTYKYNVVAFLFITFQLL